MLAVAHVISQHSSPTEVPLFLLCTSLQTIASKAERLLQRTTSTAAKRTVMASPSVSAGSAMGWLLWRMHVTTIPSKGSSTATCRMIIQLPFAPCLYQQYVPGAAAASSTANVIWPDDMWTVLATGQRWHLIINIVCAVVCCVHPAGVKVSTWRAPTAGKCHPMPPSAPAGEPLQEPPRFPWMVAMAFSVIGVPDTLAAAGAFYVSLPWKKCFAKMLLCLFGDAGT